MFRRLLRYLFTDKSHYMWKYKFMSKKQLQIEELKLNKEGLTFAYGLGSKPMSIAKIKK